MYKSKICIFLALVVLVVTPFYGYSARGDYGRAWWGSAPHDERIQFIAGYLDCAAYDVGNARLSEAQWNVIEPEITQYYASHSKSARRTVPALILTFGATSRSTDLAPEQYPEKHGIFDGDYWRQISASGRLGFVEGYVTCRTSVTERPHFATRPAAWYVIMINKAYNPTSDSDMDDAYASRKIATVIQQVAK